MGQLAAQAYQLYQEARDERQQIETHTWLNLPYTTKIQPIKTKYELGQQSRTKPVKITNLLPRNEPLDDQDTIIDINHMFRAERDQPFLDQPFLDQPRVIPNDQHNVHDHSVITTLKQSIDNLRQQTPMVKNRDQCMAEIRQYLNNLPDNDKRTDALNALEVIEKSCLPLSFTDLKESEALSIVWNRICQTTDSGILKTLKENLGDELAECIEHDKPVCPTGRISRIIDTLNGVDQNVVIKSSFMINDEMMTKASQIRDQAYDQLTDQQKADVDSLAPNDYQKQWTQQLKDKIKQTLFDDYVKTNILLESAFDTTVDQWINEI